MEVLVNTRLNISKGFVYIYDYNKVYFEACKAMIEEQYCLSSVVEATGIMQRRKQFLLNIPNELPLYLDIPGNMMMTNMMKC